MKDLCSTCYHLARHETPNEKILYCSVYKAVMQMLKEGDVVVICDQHSKMPWYKLPFRYKKKETNKNPSP